MKIYSYKTYSINKGALASYQSMKEPKEECIWGKARIKNSFLSQLLSYQTFSNVGTSQKSQNTSHRFHYQIVILESLIKLAQECCEQE